MLGVDLARPLQRHRQPSAIAQQSLESYAVVRLDAHAGVKRKRGFSEGQCAKRVTPELEAVVVRLGAHRFGPARSSRACRAHARDSRRRTSAWTAARLAGLTPRASRKRAPLRPLASNTRSSTTQ